MKGSLKTSVALELDEAIKINDAIEAKASFTETTEERKTPRQYLKHSGAKEGSEDKRSLPSGIHSNEKVVWPSQLDYRTERENTEPIHTNHNELRALRQNFMFTNTPSHAPSQATSHQLNYKPSSNTISEMPDSQKPKFRGDFA